jgi:predicted dehydrogenase
VSLTAAQINSTRRPRLGFSGTGWIGRMRMRAVALSGLAEISAIADPDPRSITEAAAIAPGAELLTSFDELLARDLDGIVIATPSALHASQCMSALRAGKAIFCQKPLACSAEDTQNIVEQARKANRLLATDFVYRCTAGMRAIRELVNSGELGQLYAVELCFHNSYGPDRSWYYDRALSGGGCVIDLGIHLVDLALWTLGFPQLRRVSSRLFRHGQPFRRSESEEVEDYACAELDLGEDVFVRLACSWGRPMSADALIQALYHGTNGGAEFRNIDGSFFDFRADHYHGRHRKQLCGPPDDWGGRALLQWIQQLTISNRFAAAAEEIAMVANVVDAIYESSGNPGVARSGWKWPH